MPVKVGDVISDIQLTVLETLAVLPHASVAIKVLTCDLVQPEDCMAPSLCVIVADPHASLAAALPNAVSISGEVGLHPNVTVLNVPVNTGGEISDVHEIVLDTVEELPHASTAVNILV